MCFPREPSPPLCTLTSSNHQKCEIKKSFTLCTRWQLCTYLVGVKSIITLMAPKKSSVKNFCDTFPSRLNGQWTRTMGRNHFQRCFLIFIYRYFFIGHWTFIDFFFNWRKYLTRVFENTPSEMILSHDANELAVNKGSL
jgi:hypothetical protein